MQDFRSGKRVSQGRPRKSGRFVGGAIVWVIVAGGCTFVENTAGSETVTVADTSRVASCERVGETTVSVLSKVAFVDRSRDKMAEELETLARNEAVAKNADTIVATSELRDGRQKFDLYRCGSS